MSDERAASSNPTVESLLRDHGPFVWRTLARLGVRGPDVEDMFQEVFVVVHRRLDSFDRSARETTWLFGICLRVASDYRRRRRRKPEHALGDEQPRSTGNSPEDHAMSSQVRARVEAALDAMDDDKRAVFVLFELEGMSCSAIAELVGAKVGTVYSRLHAARAEFRAAIDEPKEVRR